ncbi:MAG: hypothetical protein AAGJ32_10015 [Pseudomonadota bacterium]
MPNISQFYGVEIEIFHNGRAPPDAIYDLLSRIGELLPPQADER